MLGPQPVPPESCTGDGGRDGAQSPAAPMKGGFSPAGAVEQVGSGPFKALSLLAQLRGPMLA